ncbi:MAG: glycoside hydrolase family 2 TIM barrel-domain containing protein [Candidatus Omnitrophota bacterium]
MTNANLIIWNMKNYKQNGLEDRRYIRLNTFFPVEFAIISLNGKDTFSEFNQSFTRDVGEGGICLEINNLKSDLALRLISKAAKLRLQINMPFSTEPISAIAEIAWVKNIKSSPPNKFLMGISYTAIKDKDRKRILSFAKMLRLKPKIIAGALAALAIAVIVSGAEVFKKENLRRNAESRLTAIELEKSKLTAELGGLGLNKIELESRLKLLEGERLNLEKNLALAKEASLISPDEVSRLEEELLKAQTKSGQLSEELARVLSGKVNLEERLKFLEDVKSNKPVKVVLLTGGVVMGNLESETKDKDLVMIKVSSGTITLRRDQISSIAVLTQEEMAKLAKERLDLEKRIKDLAKHKMARQRINGAADGAQLQTGRGQTKGPASAAIPREIETAGVVIRHGRIYVDGGLFFIKGVAYSIGVSGLSKDAEECFLSAPLDIIESDFSMMKKAGVNTVRTYTPLSDAALDIADKYGIKVMEQIISPSAYTDYSSDAELSDMKKQALDVVRRHKDKKCILMWLLWNDGPFCYEAPENPILRYGFERVNKFMKEIYFAVKAADERHPVCAANVLNVEGYDLGFDFLDVIGCNAYIGGYGFNWKGKQGAIKSVEHILEISGKYDKPVVITETGFSAFVKKDSQYKAIETQIKTLDEKAAGIVIFEWVDEWWRAGNADFQDKDAEEHWGLLTSERKPKSGFEAVSKLFNAIPTNSLGYSEERDIAE